jgi:hypothetical protein
LRHAADVSETSFESLTTGIGLLTKTLGEAKAGEKGALGNFKRYLGGTSIKQFKTTEDALYAISAAVQKAGTSAEKNAILSSFFGRSGRQLSPLLSEGPARIKELMQELSDLEIITGKDAEKFDDFGDNFARAKNLMHGLRITIGKALLPVMDQMINRFLKFYKANKNQIIQNLTSLMRGLGNAVQWLLNLLSNLDLTTIKSALSAISKNVNDIFVILGFGNPKLKQTNDQLKEITPTMRGIRFIINSVFVVILAIVWLFKKWILLWEIIGEWLYWIYDKIKSIYGWWLSINPVLNVIKWTGAMWEIIKSLYAKIKEGFGNLLSEMSDDFKNKFARNFLLGPILGNFTDIGKNWFKSYPDKPSTSGAYIGQGTVSYDVKSPITINMTAPAGVDAGTWGKTFAQKFKEEYEKVMRPLHLATQGGQK